MNPDAWAVVAFWVICIPTVFFWAWWKDRKKR
jgi:hypothetical protein